MSKRRSRKQQAPNLPEEMLERARQQLEGENGDGDEAAEVEAKVPTAAADEPRAASPKVAAPARSRGGRRPGLQAAQSRGERKNDINDTEYIRNRLANPTRFVTVEELRSEYGYVARDLRTMGILAAALLITMVVIERLI